MLLRYIARRSVSKEDRENDIDVAELEDLSRFTITARNYMQISRVRFIVKPPLSLSPSSSQYFTRRLVNADDSTVICNRFSVENRAEKLC